MRSVDKEPSAVTVPKAFLGAIGVLLMIGSGVMPDMVRTPAKCRVLKSPSSCNQQNCLRPAMTFETSMGEQPMVPHRDAQAGEDIEGAEQYPIEETVSVEKTEKRRPYEGDKHDQAKKRKRLVGKPLSPDCVRHSRSSHYRWTKMTDQLVQQNTRPLTIEPILAKAGKFFNKILEVYTVFISSTLERSRFP